MIQNFIHDATRAAALRAEMRAGLAFELLIGLWAVTTPGRDTHGGWVPALDRSPPRLRKAVAAVGEESGELWLHLLGIAVEADAETANDLVDAVAALDAAELRRQLVGVYVPAWRTVAGVEDLEAAAAGNARAAARLFANERYYAGRARESLERVLPLSPRETKRRVLAALQAFAQEVLEPGADALAAELEAELAARRPLGERLDPVSLVSAVVRGYTYEPEREASRVLLVPHVVAQPWLLLCQHRETRIICYPLGRADTDEDALRDRAVSLGRALADAARVAMLRRLADGEASLGALAELAGVAKSTAHHHVAQLRAAGLVEVRGNMRAYFYALREEGLVEAAELLRKLASPGRSDA
jgi:DNA-binding transcriptional ArsR family regulator